MSVEALLVELLGGEALQEAQSVPRILDLAPCQSVAQPEGAEEQVSAGPHAPQSLLVFGIEQETVVELFGAHVELVLAQSPVEHQLHDVLLLRLGSLGVEVGRVEGHEVAFARLLLDDDGSVARAAEEVHTSLYAQHLAEESGLKDGLLGAVGVHLRGQCLVDEVLDVALLQVGVGVEVGPLLGRSHVGTGEQRHAAALEEVVEAALEWPLLLVNGLVEELAGEIAEEDGRCVGLRRQFVDQVDEGRLGVALEAAGYGCYINKVVGFEDDELGHAHVSLVAQPHEMERGSAPEQVLEIGPIAVVGVGEIGVGRPVADFQFPAVLLVGGVDVVVVPCVDQAAQAVLVESSPGVVAVGLREEGLERQGDGLPAVEVVDQVSRGLDVVGQVAPQLLRGGGGGLCEPVEVGARVVYQPRHLVGHAVLVEQVVEFGKQPVERESAVLHALVDNLTEQGPQAPVPFLDVYGFGRADPLQPPV